MRSARKRSSRGDPQGPFHHRSLVGRQPAPDPPAPLVDAHLHRPLLLERTPRSGTCRIGGSTAPPIRGRSVGRRSRATAAPVAALTIAITAVAVTIRPALAAASSLDVGCGAIRRGTDTVTPCRPAGAARRRGSRVRGRGSRRRTVPALRRPGRRLGTGRVGVRECVSDRPGGASTPIGRTRSGVPIAAAPLGAGRGPLFVVVVAVAPQHPLELAHHRDLGQLAGVRLVGRRHGSRHLHRRIQRELAGVERGDRDREVGPPSGEAHHPLGPHRRHPGLPRQPVLGRVDPPAVPPPCRQRLRHHRHEHPVRGVHHAAHLRHPTLERLHLHQRSHARAAHRRTGILGILPVRFVVIEHVFDLIGRRRLPQAPFEHFPPAPVLRRSSRRDGRTANTSTELGARSREPCRSHLHPSGRSRHHRRSSQAPPNRLSTWASEAGLVWGPPMLGLLPHTPNPKVSGLHHPQIRSATDPTRRDGPIHLRGRQATLARSGRARRGRPQRRRGRRARHQA